MSARTIPVLYVRRAVVALDGGARALAESPMGALLARLGADLAAAAAGRADDEAIPRPDPERLVGSAGAGAPAPADRTTPAALRDLLRALLTTPTGRPRPVPPPSEAFLHDLRGHPDPLGEALRAACVRVLIAQPERANPDERAAALAALLRLGGILRPAALDLLASEGVLVLRGGRVCLRHAGDLLAAGPAHVVPLDAVTLVAWHACRRAGVWPRDDDAWLARHGHSGALLPAVARQRLRLEGLPDWLALHLTGEQDCTPPTDDSVDLEDGWLPVLLRGASVDATPLPAAMATPRGRAAGAAGAAGGTASAAGIPGGALRGALAAVTAAVRTPTRYPSGYRDALCACIAAQLGALAEAAGCARDASPADIAAALGRGALSPVEHPGGLAALTLLVLLRDRATHPVYTPGRARGGTGVSTGPTGRAARRYLRPSSLAAYWQDGLAILTAMAEVPPSAWTPVTLARAFPVDLAPETHRRRARVLLAWARVARRVLRRPTPWTAPPPRPAAPASRAVLSPGQLDALLRDLAAYPYRGADRAQRGRELVLLAALLVCYRCRVTEAATRLYSDVSVDLGHLYIPAADAKGRQATSRPRGWLPAWAEALLGERRAEAARESAAGGLRAPLLPSAADRQRLRGLLAALRYHLGRHGLTPHDLRHTGITVDVAAAVALQTGEPAPSAPDWLQAHRVAPDPLLLAAARAGHRGARTAATTYVHCATWAIARYRAPQADRLAALALPLPEAARLLGANARGLRTRLRRAGIGVGVDAATTTLTDVAAVIRQDVAGGGRSGTAR